MKDTGIKTAEEIKLGKINMPPLSQQAREAIHGYIRSMDLKQGTKLPREEALAEMLGVSRITVRKALADLAAEGVVFRRQGKGTFVNAASQNITVTFNPVMEFTQMIQKSGYKPSMKLLDLKLVKRNEKVREILRLPKEETLVEAHKAFFADEKLCVLCRDFYALSLVGGLEAYDQLSAYEKSVYPYIYEKSGIKLKWDKVEIGAAVSTEIEVFADYLREQETGVRPYLYLKEINYGEDDRPLIYVEEYIDTSIIQYHMIRQKDIDYGKIERR
ncbi:MAG: GntR family transcriptional regulator [Eubacteriales bacterium]|nr:GntR family transcriptional regulator [Eubacteriales bacterium]